MGYKRAWSPRQNTNRPSHSPAHSLSCAVDKFVISLLLFWGVLLLFPGSLRAETDAPSDTPLPVVVQTIDDWAVGGGLLYWGVDCFAVEFGRSGSFHRIPLAGGVQRTLETTDGSHCDMPFGLIAQDDGVYYTDLSEKRIERTPLNEPYTGTPVATPAESDLPDYFAQLEMTAEHIYWPSYGGGKILRASRATGAIEIVADGLNNPLDVLVVGGAVYYTDRTGVWQIGVGCATLPCNDAKSQIAAFSANTRGNNLFYRRRSALQYNIYWVQNTSNGSDVNSSIQVVGCNIAAACGPPFITPTTFYAPPSNWAMGGLISDGSNLFWSEVYATAGVQDGKVKRKPFTSGDAVDIAVNQTYIDTRKMFIVNGNLYFARLATAGAASGVYLLPLNASAITRDLAADAMEVTQGIQNLANATPLAKHKTTYVRAYARQLSGPDSPTVEVRLVGKRNDLDLPGSPLTPVNGMRSLRTGGGYDRARLNDGWYFLLPQTWTEGIVTLEFQVDPRNHHTDTNVENDDLSRTIVFQDQPPVCVWTVPVRTHTPLPSVNDPNFWGMVDQFKRRWPVPAVWIFRDTEPDEELEVCWYGPIPYPCFGPYELEDGWGLTNGIPDRDKVITSLWTRALLSFNPDACDDIDAPVHFMGLVHPDANNGGAAGYASTVSKQSWVQLPEHAPNPIQPGWNQMREGSVMAQELAHNHGRKHVNCGSPDNIDNSYPYPPCQIANVGADSYYGFDVITLQPIRPDQTADFMSYANRSWVSDYTWRNLIDKFSNAGAASLPVGSDTGDSIFISGLVDMGAPRGEIVTALTLPTASLPPAARQQAQAARGDHGGIPHAAYSLRLLDPGGKVIISDTLTLLEMDDHVADSDSALFSAIFTPPISQAAKIELMADAKVVFSDVVGVNLPTVAIQQPVAGVEVGQVMVIEWSSSDPDADDQLLHTLQYSHDSGASWHTLATNYPSTPNGHYILTLNDLGSLHGSAVNAARIRVLASDGLHTGIAVSQPFTVKNRKPTPFIVTPVGGQTFPAGAAVLFSGGASDAEDGGLNDSALRWSVDGKNADEGETTIAFGLTTGLHTAVLTGTDSANNAASVSVTFAVAPLSIPLSAAPTLDGSCNDAAYAGAAQVQTQDSAPSSQVAVRLLRSSDHLWVCFTGMTKGAATPGAFAGVRVDVNHSRDPLAQSSDIGFFAGEDGDVFTLVGDGAGGFAGPGPSGLHAQVSSQLNSWSAELRMDAVTLGGWGHLVGLNVGHYWLNFQGDDYVWPFSAVWNQPVTWAAAALGDQPVLTAIAPYTASAGSAAFTLQLEGGGFVSGTVALWNGVALPTTVVDGEHLAAAVGAAQLAAPGQAQVSARSPAPDNLESNKLPFIVHGPTPVIASLTPASVGAGSPTILLTIKGSNFAADSQVLWNGAGLTTQFINADEVRAQIDASLLRLGQSVGVAVRNPSPAARISAPHVFEVQTQAGQVYLPLVKR